MKKEEKTPISPSPEEKLYARWEVINILGRFVQHIHACKIGEEPSMGLAEWFDKAYPKK